MRLAARASIGLATLAVGLVLAIGARADQDTPANPVKLSGVISAAGDPVAGDPADEPQFAGDGGGNVLVGPGHDDPTPWRQFHHDPAFLAQAAARVVHVSEVDPDQADVTGETAERQPESLLDVNP